MNRLLLIICFSLALFDTSFGQKPKRQKSKPIEITKSIDSTINPLKDSLFLDSLSKVYIDSILSIVDSSLKDTSFANSIDTTLIANVGEFSASEYKFQFPIRPLGWTSDFEHIFSDAEITELNLIINNFEKETTIEIAIVTIESTWTTVAKFDSLVLATAKNWGIGKKDTNNGIVLGLSSGLRKIRICNGYGIEAKLSDFETKKIMDEIIIPQYKQGNYFEGTKKGLLAIMNKVR